MVGWEKRWVREAACAEEGVRARRLVGRWERGSAEVGTDSGPAPDILGGGGRFGLMSVLCCGLVVGADSREEAGGRV